MIELDNNSTRSPYQKLELEVMGEDGLVFFIVKDGDTGETVIEATTDNMNEVRALRESLSTAVEEAMA